MAKKSPAADRTIGMFEAPEDKPSTEVEAIAEEPKAGRVSLEADADRMRDNAFKGQEWTTKFFGKTEAPGNEYRVTHRDGHHYVERLNKQKGAATAYSYTGVMIPDEDLFAFASVVVEAVRSQQKRLKDK